MWRCARRQVPRPGPFLPRKMSCSLSGQASTHICRITPLVLTYCNLAMDAASTASSRRDLLTVDLRGMKAALVEHARARGVSPSEFVRAALAEALRSAVSVVGSAPNTSPPTPEPCVRLSLRMSGEDRVAVLARARQAGLTPGAFVASLVAGVPVLTSGQSRGEHLARWSRRTPRWRRLRGRWVSSRSSFVRDQRKRLTNTGRCSTG
jgi:hypothetical protein